MSTVYCMVSRKKRSLVEQEAVEGISIYPPEEGGVLPLVLCFWFTLINVRKPGIAKYAPYSFFVCLAWMGVCSYFMVSWVETVGATAGIPIVIMGLTFLAVGTSVPDMLSAVIVAKQGEADKAVSSAIGSNVFDICVGIAFPWLLFWIGYQEPVYVEVNSLFISILIFIIISIFYYFVVLQLVLLIIIFLLVFYCYY